MEQADFIWMNGEFVRWEDAKVHVLTHALHYGSGVFEGIRAYETERGTAVFRHHDHLDRLRARPSSTTWTLPYSLEKLREATHELIGRNKLRSCYIRPLVYRGYGEMGLFPLNVPGRGLDRRLVVGRLPRRGGQEQRRPLQGLVLAAHVARLLHPAGEGLRPVPELDPREGRDREGRLRRGDPARRARQRLRGHRRERLRRSDGAISTPPQSASILDGITRRR